ncbi:MAG: 50S ribosomal protein L17 [Actinobacteria bacterium]|nr:50S ribosomal protein L17 [Actinomycetota bacterium]
MPKPSKGPRLGSGPAHERLLLGTLATQLIKHGKVETTLVRAKRLRPYVEKLITAGKKGDLPARRRVMKVITEKGAVHTLFTEIGPRFAQRNGGYTRITKIGIRKGDAADMAIIEILAEGTPDKKKVLSQAEAIAKRAAKAESSKKAAAARVADRIAARGKIADRIASRASSAPVKKSAKKADAEVAAEGVEESAPVKKTAKKAAAKKAPAKKAAAKKAPAKKAAAKKAPAKKSAK